MPEKTGLVHMIPILAEHCEVYNAIAAEIKVPVLDLLVELLEPVAVEIRTDFEKNPDCWWKGHFHWGLAIRNQLRCRGYGEDYFGVSNLDNIYIYLVEDALKLY
jgi:hypothetical protein